MGLFSKIKNIFSKPKNNLSHRELSPNPLINEHNDSLDGPDISDIGIILRNPETMDVEDHIKNAIPSKHGLLPNELKLLEQAHYFKSKENRFQAYWKYQYGFNDVQQALKKLEDNGFITASNFEETLQKSVIIPELKRILKEHGAKISGKKAELVQRVLGLQDVEEIKKQFDNRPYKLTSKGEMELSENSYIKSPFFTVWQLNKWVHERPNVEWRDIVEQKLIEGGNNYQLYLWFLDKKDYLKSFRCLLRTVRNRIEEFPAFSPFYYGLPDRNEEKFLNDVQLLLENLNGVYLPKLMYFQDLFSLNEDKFKELVRRELEFDKSTPHKFSVDFLMSIIFDEGKQRITLLKSQENNRNL